MNSRKPNTLEDKVFEEDKWFQLRQLALSQEVHEMLKRQVGAYEAMVEHRDDSDIVDRLRELGMPTSLPTITRLAMLLSKGVLVENSAYILLALQPLAPFPKKEEVFEQIWEELGWSTRR